jgi:hypothetical protein
VVSGHTISHGRCAVFGGGTIGQAELQAQTHQKSVSWKSKETACLAQKMRYGWMPHNAGFGFLDLAPSILHSNWFWDYIS